VPISKVKGGPAKPVMARTPVVHTSAGRMILLVVVLALVLHFSGGKK
jgi:hypothetical protein